MRLLLKHQFGLLLGSQTAERQRGRGMWLVRSRLQVRLRAGRVDGELGQRDGSSRLIQRDNVRHPRDGRVLPASSVIKYTLVAPPCRVPRLRSDRPPGPSGPRRRRHAARRNPQLLSRGRDRFASKSPRPTISSSWPPVFSDHSAGMTGVVLLAGAGSSISRSLVPRVVKTPSHSSNDRRVPS